MMSYQIRVGPNPQTGILVRREKIRQKDTPGRRSHEDGDRKQLCVYKARNTTDYWHPPEARTGRGMEQILSQSLQRKPTPLTI